jgi:hypothetical protein
MPRFFVKTAHDENVDIIAKGIDDSSTREVIELEKYSNLKRVR